MKALMLASGSPRRKQLLEWAGFALEVAPAHIDESRHEGESPEAYAERLAVEKGEHAPNDVTCVSADTVVALGDDVLGKPRDRAEGFDHLRRLSGRWHRVLTGVCVRRGRAQRAFVVSTRVRFRELSDDEIVRYLQTGEADDKAGAYGIQGIAGAMVAEVQGSWTNVKGLPLEETLAAIEAVQA